MGINELEIKIAKMQEWQALADEAGEMAEAIRDEIKAEMLSRETEELTAGRFIIRWTTTIRNVFDSANFKKALPEVYKQYTRPSTARRFSVSE